MMKDRFLRMPLNGVWFLLILMSSVSSAWGIEVFLPPVKSAPGKEIRIPVTIDRVDNLAGVKISLTYDARSLTFKKAEKTPRSSSLMHIVNDKKPGALIIVMAGARGVKGEKLEILNLFFEVNPDPKAESVEIAFRETQLMSDDLKDLDHSFTNGVVTVVKAAAGKTDAVETGGSVGDSKTEAPEAASASEKPVMPEMKPETEKKTAEAPAPPPESSSTPSPETGKKEESENGS